MTYLQMVNGVLTRLREDNVTTVDGNDDVVVLLVKDFINDAKRQVENAHTWTALATEWEFTTTPNDPSVVLTNTASSCIIDYIYDDNGVELNQADRSYVRKQSKQAGSTTNTPRVFCIDGVGPNSDLKLKLFPTPKEAEDYTVYGFKGSDDLTADTDTCHIAPLAIIYMATAMAARERGEVGGQTPQELLLLAKEYLLSAVAQDATNSDLENIWTTV
jgi:hypothetical protein